MAKDDVWAVGWQQTTLQDPTHLLLLHWDGTAWRNVPAPPTSSASRILALAARNAGDVWAVGAQGAANRPLVGHWNGTRWSLTTLDLAVGALTGVVVTAGSDVWAVGDSGLVRWDGTRWNIAPPILNPPKTPAFSAVVAGSGNRLWAVGEKVWHWNGTIWDMVSGPNGLELDPANSYETPESPTAHFYGAGAVGGQLWAVGSTARSGRPLILTACGTPAATTGP